MSQLLEIWQTPAFSDTPILADSRERVLLDGPLAIRLRGCRGEVLSFSLCLRAPRDCVVLPAVNPSPLGMRFRWVKRWWQKGQDGPAMTPELLVNDLDLVTAQPDGSNELRSPSLDTDVLRGTRIKANETQQLWGTVRIPEDCNSNRYMIPVEVEVGVPGLWHHNVVIAVSVDVLPFELAESPMTFSAYYRAALSFSGSLKVVTPESQYRADLLNMADHGGVPLCYEDLTAAFASEDGIEKVEDLVRVWQECGFRKGPFYAVTTGLPWVNDDNADAVTAKICRMVLFFREHGYDDLYCYARDDASASQLQAALPYWKKVHNDGAKVFASCGSTPHAEVWPITGTDLDLFMHNDVAANPRPWSSAGSKAWLYGPTSSHLPDSQYRRRYGLGALAAGWTGSCLYAYQHPFGSSWNDYDGVYGDHMLAYRCDSGPIDTIQFEAYRQAQNDVRYLETAKQMGITVDTDGLTCEETRDAVIDSILKTGGR